MNFQVAQNQCQRHHHHRHGYSSFSNYTQRALEPLTIQPISTPTTESIWSPFSAPSLSPYQEPKSSFRYSTYSPSVASYHWPSWTNQPWSAAPQQQLVSPIASSIANGNWSGQLYNRNTNSAGPSKSHANKLPKRSEQVDMSGFIRMAEIKTANGGRGKLCTFCRSNDESEPVYRSHSLKDANDKITCPILLQYTCSECGASGQNSHTRKYCPVLQKRLRLEMLSRLVSLSNKENGF